MKIDFKAAQELSDSSDILVVGSINPWPSGTARLPGGGKGPDALCLPGRRPPPVTSLLTAHLAHRPPVASQHEIATVVQGRLNNVFSLSYFDRFPLFF